jgi:hypothetical protein
MDFPKEEEFCKGVTEYEKHEKRDAMYKVARGLVEGTLFTILLLLTPVAPSEFLILPPPSIVLGCVPITTTNKPHRA